MKLQARTILREMGTRIHDWWGTHWLPVILVVVAMTTAFAGAGWIWGREVTILQVCSGLGNQDCPPERFVELNLLAGWAAVGLVAFVVLILGVVARRLDR